MVGERPALVAQGGDQCDGDQSGTTSSPWPPGSHSPNDFVGSGDRVRETHPVVRSEVAELPSPPPPYRPAVVEAVISAMSNGAEGDSRGEHRLDARARWAWVVGNGTGAADDADLPAQE